jgi:hypothetical protein
MVDLDPPSSSPLGEKSAAATFTRTFGFHPLVAFVDHGAEGAGGKVLGRLLRAGNANATPLTRSTPTRALASS